MHDTQLISLSVFLPTYNEEENIKTSVEKIIEAIRRNPIIGDYEIIIINDGSGDRTGDIADALSLKNDRIRVVNHEHNKGYGSALISGFTAARFDYVFFTDADLQFDVTEISKLLDYIPEYTVVLGHRAPRRDPLMRLINAKGWNILNRIFFGLKVKDIDCAFKLFKRSVLDDVHLISRGAMISAELLIRLSRKDIIFKEVPVTHLPRLKGTPTGAKPSVIILAFKELLQLYNGDLGHITQRQAIKFGVIGIMNTLLDFALYVSLTRFTFFFEDHLLLAKALSFGVGTLSSFVFNRYWTFNKSHAINFTEVLKFYSVVSIGLAINITTMHVALSTFNMHDLFAVVLATGFTFIWNFTLSKFWVFTEKSHETFTART